MRLQYLEPADIQGERQDERAPNYGRNVDGYGSKIPTSRWLKVGGRWRRVYCTIYSNIGTCWVIVNGERKVVR